VRGGGSGSSDTGWFKAYAPRLIGIIPSAYKGLALPS